MTTTPPAAPDTATIAAEPEVADSARALPYYREVDPRELRTDENSRVVGDILQTRPNLVASMAVHGFDSRASVIHVAEDPDGGLRVLVGFHRTAAAIAIIDHADPELRNPDLRVGVLIHASDTTRLEMLLAQGIENIHREGFTEAEEARYYHQLALEGLDDDAITRELAQPIDRVRAGRTVGASAPTHDAMQQLPEIDLLTMAKLAEFADDEAVHESLVNTLATRGSGGLDFEIRSVRNRRDRRKVETVEHDRLTALGYAIIADDDGPPAGATKLADLTDGQETSPIDPQQHADCPGRAAHVFVDSDLSVDITEFCIDAAEHGHRRLAKVNIENAEQQLREQGVLLVSDDLGDNDGMAELRELSADADAGNSLTAAEHAECPGHAAYVTLAHFSHDAVVRWVCTDYAKHGHHLRFSPPADSRQHDPAYQAAERKRARVNNAAWKLAKTARREWLTDFFSGWRRCKTNQLPVRHQHWLGLGQMLAGDYLHEAAPGHHYACSLLGMNRSGGYRRSEHPIAVLLRRKNTSEPQAIMARLALLVGACEQHWDYEYTTNADGSWRVTNDDSRLYFELLASLGYPLSPVEQLINNPDLDAERWPHLAPKPEVAEDADEVADSETERLAE